MPIYYIVLIIAVLFAFLYEKTNLKIWWINSFILIWLFAGLRYYVGIDYESYTTIFLTILDSNTEPAFRLLNLTITLLGLKVQWVFLISGFITFFLFYKGIRKYSSDIFLSVFLFLFCGFFIESLNIVRQYIAISIFFYSIQYILKRDLIRYVSLIVLASCFHYSAILLVFAFFALNLNIGRRWYFLLFCAFLLPFFLPITSFLSLIPGYEVYFPAGGMEREDSGSANLGIGFLSKLLIGVICLSYYDRIGKISAESRLFLNGFLIYLFLLSLFRDFIVVVRLGYYFHVFLILLIPKLVQIFDRKSKSIIYLVIFLYGFLLLSLSLVSKESKIVPYDFTLDLL